MMKIDFILDTYSLLLNKFKENGYKFCTFEQFISDNINSSEKIIILRHDVDKKPENSLKTAEIENKSGIYASYYFRMVRASYDENIIKQIADLGHEIGYHYEDLSKANGNYVKAKDRFENNLNTIRKLYPVKTICMHGSPLSRWDNKLIWQRINYRDYGIIGEPYFDINFDNVLYLTDTGRRWNGNKLTIRDKVETKYNVNFKSSFDIIKTLEKNELPNQIMINTHPQRWNDNITFWLSELINQNIKNIIKSLWKR